MIKPTAVELESFEPGSAPWLDQRSHKIGGSEISAVLGLSTFDSHYSLWCQKQDQDAWTRDLGTKSEVEWGNRLEPAVIEKFLSNHAHEYASGGRGTYVQRERRWMICSPDQLLTGTTGGEVTAVFEAKTSPYGEQWGPAGDPDGIPIYYFCQLLWNMFVMGVRVGWIAVLIRGSDYREYRLDLDEDPSLEDDMAELIEHGEKFVYSLIHNLRPDIDDHSATLQMIREQHPKIDPGSVEISSDIAGSFLSAKIKERELKIELREASARLLDAMGDMKDAHLCGEKFAYRMAQTRDGQPGLPFVRASEKALKQLMHPRPDQDDDQEEGNES